MKKIALFFYRFDDVLLNMFFILFLTMTVVNNSDNLTIVIIFGLIDLSFITYTLGRIFGKIKHFPRVSIEGDTIRVKNFFSKAIFKISESNFIRSTSMGGVIDIIKIQNLNNNKQRTIFLHDLEPELKKQIIEIHKKY